MRILDALFEYIKILVNKVYFIPDLYKIISTEKWTNFFIFYYYFLLLHKTLNKWKHEYKIFIIIYLNEFYAIKALEIICKKIIKDIKNQLLKNEKILILERKFNKTWCLECITEKGYLQKVSSNLCISFVFILFL